MATSLGLPKCINNRAFLFSNMFVVPKPRLWIDRFTYTAKNSVNIDSNDLLKYDHFEYAMRNKYYLNEVSLYFSTGSRPNFINARIAVGAVYN